MTAFWGMDPGQVRGQGDSLRTASGEVATLNDRLQAAIGAATWDGADAEQFRSRWSELSSSRLSQLCEELSALSDELTAEVEQQETASAPESGAGEGEHAADGDDRGSGFVGGTGAGGDGRGDGRDRGSAGDGSGYLDRDNPWIPNWMENPVEGAASDLTGIVSDGIGWGFETGMDGLTWTADRLGMDTDGIEQTREDAGHLGGLLEDWATGERVPTIAELGASALLAAGSTAIAPVELFTDTGFLDPRVEVTVHGINEVQDPSAPQDLADLIYANDEARQEMFHRDAPEAFDGMSSGQIRIQTVRTAEGGEAYIVHAPPTGGEAISDPDSWGAQGNSAGWDSNLRSMAGQDSAAMADIDAAMEAAGVPPGADVMFVGHSQGGLTAAQLAADPSFNNTSGEPGTYNVTHSFSVGSPVETVVPAQGSTQVVNVAHNPVWDPTPQVPGLPSPGQSPIHIADPVPRLDLDGYRVDGSRVSAPNVQEAWLDAPEQTYGEHPQIGNAHNSVLHTSQGIDPTGGYYGSVGQNTGTDPVLSGLQRDLEGQYVGDGVTIVTDQVVEVGREDMR